MINNRGKDHRSDRSSALERLGRRLDTRNEAASYAARLELLGRTMFGALWDSEEPKTDKENQASQ